jgi:hypothetical protein
MLNVMYNQDSNPESESYPDLLYYNPFTERWEVDEVKNLDHTDNLDKDYIEQAVACKRQIPGLPILLTFIRPRQLYPSATNELTRLGIPVENGIPNQYWQHATLSWYEYRRVEGIGSVDSICSTGAMSKDSLYSVNSISNSCGPPSAAAPVGLMAHDGTDFCIACLQLEGRWHVNDSASPEFVEPDF